MLNTGKAFALAGLPVGFSASGSVAALSLPASTRTAFALPDVALVDGSAESLRMRMSADMTPSALILTRGVPLFGRGALSDSAAMAFTHEVAGRLGLSPTRLAVLAQGRRGALLPVGTMAAEVAEAWEKRALSNTVPDGWRMVSRPFMTTTGLLRVDGLATGGADPRESRMLFIATDAAVTARELRAIVERRGRSVFSWLRAMGLLTAADVVAASATGKVGLLQTSSEAGPMFEAALVTVLEEWMKDWGRMLGRTLTLRLEGLPDERFADAFIQAFVAMGPWLRRAESAAEASSLLRAALEQSASPGLTEDGFRFSAGDVDALKLTKPEQLESFLDGRLPLVLRFGRGTFSTAFSL